MDGFIDLYLPENIRSYPFISSPRTSTTIAVSGGGAEQVNRNWLQPLHRFSAPEIVRCHETIEDLREHWWITDGPASSFPFRDPLDFASCRLTKANKIPSLSAVDQILGIGDGAEATFPFSKTYTRGAFSKTRLLRLPVESTVLVALDGVASPSTDWTIDRQAGELTFDTPPGVGVVVTWGGLFDVPVRFEADDSFEQIVKAYETTGAAGLSFWEKRPCP
jgi:uncharacterized protein (TIGR02217 family)